MKQVAKVGLFAFSALLICSNANAYSYRDISPSRWCGFYAGINIGAVNNTMYVTDTNGASFLATIQQVSNPHLIGGLQAGYRIQTNPSLIAGVYGIELNANFTNTRFSKDYGSPFSFYQLHSENNLHALVLLEATGGIAVERTLLFLAAGLAYANITGTTSNLDSIAFFNSFNVGKNIFAPVLGGGIEYAFNDKFSARFKVDVIAPTSYSTTDDVGNSYQISNKIVQGTFGVNYKIT